MDSFADLRAVEPTESDRGKQENAAAKITRRVSRRPVINSRTSGGFGVFFVFSVCFTLGPNEELNRFFFSFAVCFSFCCFTVHQMCRRLGVHGGDDTRERTSSFRRSSETISVFFSGFRLTETGHPRTHQSVARPEPEDRRAAAGPVRHLYAIRSSVAARIAAQREHVQEQAPARFGPRFHGSKVSFSKNCLSQ